MKQNVEFIHLIKGKETQNLSIDFPSVCPHCGFSISPRCLSAHYLESEENDCRLNLFVSFLCSNCGMNFSSKYLFNIISFIVEEQETFPTCHTTVSHMTEVEKLSPRYVRIYDESHYAEESGLFEICGMGYRKALEILIKDYAIRFNPDKEEEIKKHQLAQCIRIYIDNDEIRKLVSASSWLGNDETHYIRKHDDYDLESFKAFIEAIEYFINSKLMVAKAAKLLQNPK